jgi:hypothetical protein
VHRPPQPLEAPHALFTQVGVQAQTFGIPPPPHVCPKGQPPANVPHTSNPVEQPLSIVPQFLSAEHAVSGVQIGMHVPFALHAIDGEHVPHDTSPPHPSTTAPHMRGPHAAAALVGRHPASTTSGVPPASVAGGVAASRTCCSPESALAPPEPLFVPLASSDPVTLASGRAPPILLVVVPAAPSVAGRPPLPVDPLGAPSDAGGFEDPSTSELPAVGSAPLVPPARAPPLPDAFPPSAPVFGAPPIDDGLPPNEPRPPSSSVSSMGISATTQAGDVATSARKKSGRPFFNADRCTRHVFSRRCVRKSSRRSHVSYCSVSRVTTSESLTIDQTSTRHAVRDDDSASAATPAIVALATCWPTR